MAINTKVSAEATAKDRKNPKIARKLWKIDKNSHQGKNFRGRAKIVENRQEWPKIGKNDGIFLKTPNDAVKWKICEKIAFTAPAFDWRNPVKYLPI